MNTLFRTPCLTLLAVAAGTLAMPVLAQTTDSAIEEITVQAPVQRKDAGRTTIGGKVEIIELTSRINITDLDLSRVADVQELDLRIEEAAKASCEQLSSMDSIVQMNQFDMGRCIRKAVDSATKQKEDAIAAAIEYARVQ